MLKRLIDEQSKNISVKVTQLEEERKKINEEITKLEQEKEQNIEKLKSLSAFADELEGYNSMYLNTYNVKIADLKRKIEDTEKEYDELLYNYKNALVIQLGKVGDIIQNAIKDREIKYNSIKVSVNEASSQMNTDKLTELLDELDKNLKSKKELSEMLAKIDLIISMDIKTVKYSQVVEEILDIDFGDYTDEIFANFSYVSAPVQPTAPTSTQPVQPTVTEPVQSTQSVPAQVIPPVRINENFLQDEQNKFENNFKSKLETFKKGLGFTSGSLIDNLNNIEKLGGYIGMAKEIILLIEEISKALKEYKDNPIEDNLKKIRQIEDKIKSLDTDAYNEIKQAVADLIKKVKNKPRRNILSNIFDAPTNNTSVTTSNDSDYKTKIEKADIKDLDLLEKTIESENPVDKDNLISLIKLRRDQITCINNIMKNLTADSKKINLEKYMSEKSIEDMKKIVLDYANEIKRIYTSVSLASKDSFVASKYNELVDMFVKFNERSARKANLEKYRIKKSDKFNFKYNGHTEIARLSKANINEKGIRILFANTKEILTAKDKISGVMHSIRIGGIDNLTSSQRKVFTKYAMKESENLLELLLEELSTINDGEYTVLPKIAMDAWVGLLSIMPSEIELDDEIYSYKEVKSLANKYIESLSTVYQGTIDTNEYKSIIKAVYSNRNKNDVFDFIDNSKEEDDKVLPTPADTVLYGVKYHDDFDDNTLNQSGEIIINM